MAMPDQGVQSKCCGAALTHTSWPPAFINFHRFDKIHTHINFSASVKLLPELASLQSSVWAGHCENIKFPQCQCCEKAFVQSMSTACVAWGKWERMEGKTGWKKTTFKESTKNWGVLWLGSSEGLVSLDKITSIPFSLWIYLYCLFAHFMPGLPTNAYSYIQHRFCAKGKWTKAALFRRTSTTP